MPKTPKTPMKTRKPKPEYVTKPMLDEALAAQSATLTATLTATMDARFAAQDARIDAKFVVMENRLSADMARHTNAIIEYLGTLLTAFEDKYRDLPARVAALEAKVTG
jgi:hypothetical protein